MGERTGSTRGFRHSAALIAPHLRKLSETRGFAVSRVLTRWDEIAGPEIAAIARPVEVSYGRKGFGATLTVLTTGANAPIVEMQKEVLRARVNAVYGYNAIARIRITQTAATGFAEAQAAFAPGGSAPPQPASGPSSDSPSDPAAESIAAEIVAPIADEGLRQALAALGRNILSRRGR